MNEKLFTDFPQVSSKEWKQKIQADLKGAAYEELISHNQNGIDIKPFYHADEHQDFAPNSPEGWKISVRIIVEDEQKTLSAIKHQLEKGAESLWLILSKKNKNISSLLSEIPIEEIPVYLEFNSLPSQDEIIKLSDFLKSKKHQVSIGIDIIGQLAKTGNWQTSLKEDHEQLKQLLRLQNNFETLISIDTSIYENAGATHTQQLAYAIAHATEYLNFIEENTSENLKNFQPLFKVSLGSNYFFEIAKLKALRILYASLVEAYQSSEEIKILAFPTKRNKTLYDYNVNMLRTTTECMSGILGGANWVANVPYDEIYHKENEFGNRISRNQLLILKHESYFDKVHNISDGSYYIQSLTQQLSEKALEIFKSIEQGGGLLSLLKEGTIQRKIKESAEKEQQLFKEGKLTLVGTNKYQNKEDKMKQDIEVNPFLQYEKRKTLTEPILQKRLAEKSEEERLKTEK